MGLRLPSRWPAAALAAIVALVAFGLWLSARRVGTWTNDEEYFVHIARVVADGLPWSLVDLPVSAFDDRGLQRLTFALLAWPLGSLGGVAGFEIARALTCLAFASAAVPAFLLGRGVGLRPGWSLAAALLTVVVPWAVLAETFLAESLAYPAALWAIYGAWQATVVAGVRADVLALALALLAGLARTNLLVLAGVAPVAVVATAAFEAHAADRRRWVGRAVRSLRAEHPLLALVFVAGAVLVALNLAGIRPGPLASLSGGYETTLKFDLAVLPDKWGFQLATLVLGVGVLPAILAPPWLASALLRGPRAERGLALCCATGAALLLVSTIYAAWEERYVMVLAPLFVLPAVVALARRDVPPWSVALTGLAVALLVGTRDWEYVADYTRFVTFSAETVFTHVALRRLEQLGAGDPRLLAALAVAVVAVAAAVVLARPRPRAAARGALAAVVVLCVFQIAQTGYAVITYADGAAASADLRERTWVDRRVGDADVAMQAEAIANELTYQPIFREAQFWNRRATLLVGRTTPLVPAIPRFGAGVGLKVDQPSGRLRLDGGGPLPRWFLVPTLFRSLGLLADPVERSAYLPLELVRLRGAPRATYSWSGTESDGWLTEGAPAAEVRLFDAARRAAPRPCVVFSLVAPAPVARPHGFVVTAGSRRISGALGSGERRTLRVPLAPGVRRIGVRTPGGFLDADGRRLGLQVVDTGLTGC